MATPKKRRVGRPTLLTRKRIAVAVELALGGETKAGIAAHLGITADTVHRWVKEGARARRDKDERGIAIPRDMRLRAEFSEALQRARAEYGSAMHGMLLGATAAGDVKAIHIALKEHDRDRWGDHQRTEISGPDGGPVQVATMSVADCIAAATAETPWLWPSPSTARRRRTRRGLMGIGVWVDGTAQWAHDVRRYHAMPRVHDRPHGHHG